MVAESEEYIDTNHTDFPKCPKCGTEFEEPCDLEDLIRDNDETTIECENCGTEYSVVLHVEYSYSTELIEEEEKVTGYMIDTTAWNKDK